MGAGGQGNQIGDGDKEKRDGDTGMGTRWDRDGDKDGGDRGTEGQSRGQGEQRKGAGMRDMETWSAASCTHWEPARGDTGGTHGCRTWAPRHLRVLQGTYPAPKGAGRPISRTHGCYRPLVRHPWVLRPL